MGTFKSDASLGHAFNVVNVGGEAFFVDVFSSHLTQKALSSRIGRELSDFFILRTH
ncbi:MULTISPECIES: hypothetical protein [unclassified Corallococcus]|uniref:hypothetical protein n=1 Tax=unclassified Corallococcus TaxID=2685029 RepID=UPI001A8BF783|nr:MULTISPECIES: hypothetical protein [unclassified Corallococcus]MBN9686404.1 hypothetical protein [Corallococcus sp. NCSPR001]WAS82169.1 hypothetical protein O0N60_22890 [Corallococcus sp. NCRR]